MAGFKNLTEIVNAETSGATAYNSWRKNPSVTPTASSWFDLSMSPGNPKPNYYASAPLIAESMAQSTDGGILHGGNVAPMKKYISEFLIMPAGASTSYPLPFVLCDYLLYYPFCDDSESGPQLMNNTKTLPRYTTGEGVQIMCVSVAARAGFQTFSVSYTNSQGVAGRTTATMIMSNSGANGSIFILAGNPGVSSIPFITLQKGDTGVRSIQSVTMNGPDVGLFTLVLIKPIIQIGLRDLTGSNEKNFIRDNGLLMPKIEDDAYLNLICLTDGALSVSNFIGTIRTIWN